MVFRWRGIERGCPETRQSTTSKNDRFHEGEVQRSHALSPSITTNNINITIHPNVHQKILSAKTMRNFLVNASHWVHSNVRIPQIVNSPDSVSSAADSHTDRSAKITPSNPHQKSNSNSNGSLVCTYSPRTAYWFHFCRIYSRSTMSIIINGMRMEDNGTESESDWSSPRRHRKQKLKIFEIGIIAKRKSNNY